MTLPKGLAETIDAFNKGCDAKSKRVAPEVGAMIAGRFHEGYKANERIWGDVGLQVLTVARLAGRLGALYAELDSKGVVEWTHARFALRDARAECQAGLGPRGKHCQDVDLDTP